MSGSPRQRRPRIAQVRYYFDADVLGLAHIVAGIREDTTYPGDPGGEVRKRLRPPCPVTDPATPDAVWIPLVAARGWSIVTRDKRIRSRPAEIAAVRDSGAKLFAITSDEQLDKWGQLEVLMRRWRDIERISAGPGPFICAITRSGLALVAGP